MWINFIKFYISMQATREDFYLSLRSYFKNKYGKRVQKITVGLPFTCPNIDGTKAIGGCIYCSEGTRPTNIDPAIPLGIQIREGMERAKRRYGEDILFTIYYQSYTNTYADINYLKKIYDIALEIENVVGINIGTRPDCAPEEVLDLLEEYAEKGLEVWVEYGLQSANFETLKFINRAHGVSDFVDAVLRTAKRKLKICAHIIIGLPGEDEEDIIETAKLLSALPINGVKIHPLHVIRGTRLAKLYEEDKFTPLELDEYVKFAVDVIEILRPDIVIHRVTGEVSEDKLIAPWYCTHRHKNKVLDRIKEEFLKRGTKQGTKQALNR